MSVYAQQTLINLFALLDPVQFSQCIKEYLEVIYPELSKQLIAVDGKTIRGSDKTNTEQQHCLSAYAAEAGLTLRVGFVQQKSNEIPAISKLLEQQADYLMALKRNQGALEVESIVHQQSGLLCQRVWQINSSTLEH